MTMIDFLLGQPPPVLDTATRETTRDTYAAAIAALTVCEQACTACAEVYLDETGQAQPLARCIRISLDCADICAATLCVLNRQTEPGGALVQAQLQACVLACDLCAEACAGQVFLHAQCATCAETCRQCAVECNRLMITIFFTGMRDERRG